MQIADDDTIRMNLEMPRRLHARLKVQASIDLRTNRQQVLAMLEEALKAREEKRSK